MRSTLTIDDAVAADLKDLAHRSNKSFKEVVNETLRIGLATRRSRKRKPYRLQPTSMGKVAPGIDLDKALRLAEALEDQEIDRKLELRK